MTTLLTRRQWLQAAGSTIAVAALAPSSRLLAQTPPAAPAPAAAPRRVPVAPGLVRLNYNENPFGPAPSAKAAMRAAADTAFRYADAEERELLDLIARREGCRPEQIVLGAGSGEILDVAGFHFGYEQGEIIAADPSYLALLNAAGRVGGKAVRVPLNARLEHDLPAMAAAVNSRTSCIYLVNPNNPTGTVCDAAELKAFVRAQSERTTVFIDEAYLELSDDFAGRTCAPLAVEGRNVVVARTFSKIFGLAGMRLGYAIMPEKLATSLRARMTGSLSIVTIAAAAASLRDEPYVVDTRAKIAVGREALLAVVKELGRDYAVPQGNFVFFRTGVPAPDFIAKMRAQGIEVGRPFPPMLDWARITIGLPDEMEKCHRALRQVLA
jgi:histidinol-phosphate aminotransferase